MDDIKDSIKKYWPYLLGGLIAIYFLTRSTGSSTSSGSGDYAAYLAAQSNAAGVNAQTQQANAAIQAQKDIADKQIELQKEDLYATAQTNYLTAQSGIIQAIGQAAGNLASSLYQPAMVAMATASTENQVALNAAAGVAVGGFNTQANLINTGASSIQSVAQAVSSMSGINVPKKSNPFETFMNSITRVGTAYVQSPFTLH